MTDYRPEPPEDLGEPGRALWHGVTAGWRLTAPELRLLAHACAEEDLIERISAELAAGELIVPGYNQQPTANGLIGELRQHRLALMNLLKALKLPDEEGRTESPSDKARRAALSRWQPTAAR